MAENIRAIKLEYDLLVRDVPMRDGTLLDTMIYLPADRPGPFPVVVGRTPYSRADRLDRGSLDLLSAGIAVIRQGCRGTGASCGEFYPWENHETDDALDTIEWLKKQPWFSGKYALAGGSYCSQTAMRAAVCGADASALQLNVPLGGVWQSMYRHGAFYFYMYTEWAVNMYVQLTKSYDDLPCWYKEGIFHKLPVMEIDRHAGLPEIPWLREWMEHPEYDEYWKAFDIEQGFKNVTAPAYIGGGWFDIFTEGTLRCFTGLREEAATEEARKYTKCVIGPWVHTGLVNPDLFGADNNHPDHYEKKSVKFMAGLMNDASADPLPDEPPLRYFVMGSNEWRGADVWPPANVQEKTLYLSSGGNANSRHGDGVLAAAPADTPADRYISNPADPVLSGGGDTPYPYPMGCNDLSGLQDRTDIVVYTSQPMQKRLTIAGRVQVQLFVKSDVPSADFCVRVTDVAPDGKAWLRCSGIRRVKALPENNVYEVTVECDSTACTFLPGHAIRLEIAGSDFPRYERNLHTGENTFTGTAMRTAHMEILHDAAHPARVILPVLPEEA